MSLNDKYIYLDSAASASDSKFYVVDDFANPNSVHSAGRDSFAILEDARKCIAKTINAKRPSEIIFTSGATESNNTAVFGIARAVSQQKNLLPYKSDKKPRIIISAIEHESVLLPALELEKEGYDLQICPVDKNGFVDIDKFEKLLTPETVLASIQLSNTEIGTIQDIKPLTNLAHKAGVYFHSDCVGSYCRQNINVEDFGLDAISFAGHKIGTAKGIGCLYLKNKTPCKPLLYGSGQESGLRGGTQNVAMASSMQKATEYASKNQESFQKLFLNLRQFIIDNIKDFEDIKLTVDMQSNPDMFLPNIIHLLYKGITSESLILHYGKYNISLSGGPACSAKDKDPSHVLKAIGVGSDYIDGALRLSFTEDSKLSDLQVFIDATKDLFKKKMR